jgi:hypothetical protein
MDRVHVALTGEAMPELLPQLPAPPAEPAEEEPDLSPEQRVFSRTSAGG